MQKLGTNKRFSRLILEPPLPYKKGLYKIVMKRIGYLYEKIFTTENLNLAIDESMKNHDKRRKAIQWVLHNRELAIKKIQENPHIIGNYKEYNRVDGMNGKVRKIKVPKYYPDQIIHHAIIRVLNPIFQKSYYLHTYACIKKKGTLKASKHLRNILQHDFKGTKYNIQLDIKKYYDNVDTKILKETITHYIKDKKVIDLLNEIIDSNGSVGIPIGNYTSQIFANVYLTAIDHYIKENIKVKHYIRYADNLLLLDSNKRKLQRAVEMIKSKLAERNLKTHSNEYVVETTMIDFCGYRHYRNFTTIRRGIFKRVRRTSLRIKAGKFSSSLMKRFTSYLGYIKNSDSFTFVSKYLMC